MKLFRSIFGGREAVGHYPEFLIEMAIERTVDGTDPRLRLVPGYRKRLRAPVIHAIDHVVALVDDIPATVAAGLGAIATIRGSWRCSPRARRCCRSSPATEPYRTISPGTRGGVPSVSQRPSARCGRRTSNSA
jgi:hypothetical protein